MGKSSIRNGTRGSSMSDSGTGHSRMENSPCEPYAEPGVGSRMLRPARPSAAPNGWRPTPLAPVTALCLVLAFAATTAARDHAAPALPGDRPSAGRVLEEPPRYGVYYDRREPSFYTGFAPRTLDPRRLHIHLGRGNQLRVTVVLTDDVLGEYARDLRQRQRAYRALIDSGRLVPTQNAAFAEFERDLAAVELERLIGEEDDLAPAALRARNLTLLARLNPGRVFHIRMPLDTVIRRWATRVQAHGRRLDNDGRLELLNAMLPTRLFVAALERDVAAALDDLFRRVPEHPDAPGALEPLRAPFVALLDRVSGGIYPVRDDALVFDEFTAIYPVGTVNAYTTWRGREIPQYPTPGRRAFTFHQRSRTIDHIPTDESYSYSPWLPYMHVGPTLHNSIHTLWWQMDVRATSFLPPAWRTVGPGTDDGTPYRYLWLLSRGPMSHGCTHLNAGHIAELRQLLPAPTEQLGAVDVYLTKSHLYDVFDIDGDLAPEAMGVRYFIAYSLKDRRPERLRARNERRAFYDWLYGGELEYDAADRGVFPTVRDCRFAGRSAVDGIEYTRVPLYEADYQPERIQFYRPVDIPFARELRKVGLHYPFPALAAAPGKGF